MLPFVVRIHTKVELFVKGYIIKLHPIGVSRGERHLNYRN